MINEIKTMLDDFYKNVAKTNVKKCYEICKWIPTQVAFTSKAVYNNKKKKNHPKKYHPTRPVRGDVYVVNFGCNVGYEFNDLHLGLILQNDTGNIFRNTTIVIPISEFKADEKFDPHVNIKITNDDLIPESIINHGFEKEVSKLKVESIICIDKSRLSKKVGSAKSEKITEVENLLKEIINLS